MNWRIRGCKGSWLSAGPVAQTLRFEALQFQAQERQAKRFQVLRYRTMGFKAGRGRLLKAAAIFPAPAAPFGTAPLGTATVGAAPIAIPATASIASTPSVATAAGRAATAARPTAATGLGFVDAQRAAHEFHVLQAVNGLAFRGLIGHLHKGKAAFTSCVPLQGEGTTHDFAEWRKQLSHIFLLSAEGEVADENAH